MDLKPFCFDITNFGTKVLSCPYFVTMKHIRSQIVMWKGEKHNYKRKYKIKCTRISPVL